MRASWPDASRRFTKDAEYLPRGAIRHWCAPSLIHTLPTEQFNQDIVSLGTHSALTAMDVARLLRSAVAIALLSTAQAIDLRDGGGRLGAGTRPIYRAIR